MNENKLFITIFLAIVAGGFTIFASVVLYQKYEEQQAIEAINKSVSQFTDEMNKINAEYQLQAAQRETIKKAKAEAKARAEKDARLLALAEQQQKIEELNLLLVRKAEFENWYEANTPDGCKENYNASKEISTRFVECVNHKMRAKGEFFSKY